MSTDHDEDQPLPPGAGFEWLRAARRDKGGALPPGMQRITFDKPERPIINRNEVHWRVDAGLKYIEPAKILDEPDTTGGPIAEALRKIITTRTGITGARFIGFLEPPAPGLKHRISMHQLPAGDHQGICSCGWSTMQKDALAVHYQATAHQADNHPAPIKGKTMTDTPHIVDLDVKQQHPDGDQIFRAACRGCGWTMEHDKLAPLNRKGRDHERFYNDHPWPKSTKPEAGSEPEDSTPDRSAPESADAYTSVELVEVLPPGKHPEDIPMVKYNQVLINGQPVRVAKDGLFVDYGDTDGGPREAVKVSVDLLIDEFRIRRVPADPQ